MNRVPAHMMRPSGWFQIGWSSDFAEGSVVAKQYFGEALVVFRTGSGDLRALDAHCLHIGAHLGLGGTVRGDRIICPFHGWEWNAEGENVCIPYEDRPNKGIRMRTWTVAERNETVYLWHDATGSAPTWDVPDAFEVVGGDIAERTFHPAHPDGEVRFGLRHLDPYVVLDNAADPAHFKTVHRTAGVPVVVESEPDGHLFRVKLGFGNSWRKDPENATGDTLDILEAGVGLSYTALGSDATPYAIILLSTTPVDDESSEMFQTVWLERAEGDDEPGRLEERMHHATHQLPHDIEIWENQRYVQRPAWTRSEIDGFRAIRLWAASFYADSDDLDRTVLTSD